MIIKQKFSFYLENKKQFISFWVVNCVYAVFDYIRRIPQTFIEIKLNFFRTMNYFCLFFGFLLSENSFWSVYLGELNIFKKIRVGVFQ